MGPSGIVGHADLMARTIGDKRISVQCQRCDAFWSRATGRDGAFTWTGVTELSAYKPGLGIVLPARSGAASLRPWPGKWNSTLSFLGWDEPRARKEPKVRFREPVQEKTPAH